MKLTQLIAAATTAAVLGTIGVSVAGATSGGSSFPAVATTTAAPSAAGAATRHPKAARKLARAGLTLAAKTIGIKPAALLQELKAGKSVADVATANHVQPQTVINALVAAGTKKIEAAKTAGKISAERAATLEGKLTARVTRLVNAKGLPGKIKDAQRHRKQAKARLGRNAIALAAKTIGIAPKVLITEVRAGKTVGQVASAHSSTPDAVINALVAAATLKIEAAKTAGKISAERAVNLEGKLSTRVTNFVNNWHPKAHP